MGTRVAGRGLNKQWLNFLSHRNGQTSDERI